MAETLDFEGRSYAERLSKRTYPLNLGSLDFLAAFDAFERKWSGTVVDLGAGWGAVKESGMVDEMAAVVAAALSPEDAAEVCEPIDVRVIEDAYVQIAVLANTGDGWGDFAATFMRYMPQEPDGGEG